MGEWDGEMKTLAQGLESALGADLVSLLLYGSAARHTEARGRSDLNLLLIVREASPAVLRRASAPLAAWARAGRRPPLIHSEVEWREAADVFPLEMDDIREAHELLAGRDPTSGVVTRPADVRHALERETRGILTRLRAAYAAVGEEGPSLEELLLASVGSVMVMLRGAVRLAGQRPSADARALVGQAARLVGFDEDAFDWVIAARGGQPPRRLAAFDDVATKYLVSVERLAAWINTQEG